MARIGTASRRDERVADHKRFLLGDENLPQSAACSQRFTDNAANTVLADAWADREQVPTQTPEPAECDSPPLCRMAQNTHCYMLFAKRPKQFLELERSLLNAIEASTPACLCFIGRDFDHRGR